MSTVENAVKQLQMGRDGIIDYERFREWQLERQQKWAEHAEWLASRLEGYLESYRTMVWPRFPDMRAGGIEQFRHLLAELQIAVDQIELLAQGKDVTHALETQAIKLESMDPPADWIVGESYADACFKKLDAVADDHDGATCD